MKRPRSSVYLALLNYPSLNKEKKIVSTSITPLSVHDIARCAATYGVKRYYVVNPVTAQKKLIGRIIEYWNEGFGSIYNRNRKKALSILSAVSDLEDVIRDIKKNEKREPKLVTTSAKRFANSISFETLRQKIFGENGIYLILLGTGWGIPDEIMMESDYTLDAVRGTTGFNHLSVRSAASIILDRLLQEEKDERRA